MMTNTTKVNGLTLKVFINNVLVGMSIGIVVALVPWALLNNLSGALMPYVSFASDMRDMVTLTVRMLPMIIGMSVAMQFKFSPIHVSSVGVATVIGSGISVAGAKGAFIFHGTGDVINAGITAAFACALVLLLGNRLKAYTILLMPLCVILLAGGFGLFTLHHVSTLTSLIGNVIEHIITLRPVLMGMLLAMLFSVMIMSPISTVGIAVAIHLSGVGAGAANLGICAAGFGLAIMGWKSNSVATSAAHVLGSPKMQMVNFISHPKIALPIVLNAAILGMFAGLVGISGTPISAGFGFSGLIGPLGAFGTMSGGYTVLNTFLVIVAFAVLPITLGIACKWLFTRVIPILSDEDYRIRFS